MGNCLSRLSAIREQHQSQPVEPNPDDINQPCLRPDILNINPSQITRSESDRSAKNLMPRNGENLGSGNDSIISSDILVAFCGYYKKSIKPEEEYHKVIGVVWTDQIKSHLPKTFGRDKINKLLCGFILVNYQIARGRYNEVLETVAKTIKTPFERHGKSPNIDRTVAHGAMEPSEFSGLQPEMQQLVMDHFKSEAERTDLGEMYTIEDILEILYTQKYIAEKDKTTLKDIVPLRSQFQVPLIRILWTMACQKPHYELERPHLMEPWKDEFLDFVTVTEESEVDVEGAIIMYYIKPVLKREGAIRSKGYVKVGVWGC